MNTPKKVGRPPRSEIEVFRTKAWFNAIAHEVGDASPFRLQNLFQPEQIYRYGERPSSSGAWDKYKSGMRSPTESVGGDPEQSIVQRVAKVHPITLEVLKHPLWTAMAASSIGVGYIARCVNDLAPRDAHFYASFTALNRSPLALSIFEAAGQKIWVDFGDWESAFNHLAINLMLLKNDVVRHDPNALKGIAKTVGRLLGFVSKSPWVGEFHEDLYDCMERRVWGSLFDRYKQNIDTVDQVSGWRKSIPEWII